MGSVYNLTYEEYRELDNGTKLISHPYGYVYEKINFRVMRDSDGFHFYPQQRQDILSKLRVKEKSDETIHRIERRSA